jgi:hypothetical protein
MQIARGFDHTPIVLANSPSSGWVSRSFPIHLFGPIFGIIGTHSHSRKEAYWPSRHVCAGDWIESENRWAHFLAAAKNRRARSCVPLAARSWEPAPLDATSAAQA